MYANTYQGTDPTKGAAPPPGTPLNPNGYIAIELHNPYNTPLTLNHWIIGTITRPAVAATMTVVTALPTGLVAPPPQTPNVVLPSTPNGYGPDPAFLGGGLVVIPANGYIVLENHVEPAGTNCKYE